MCSSTESKPATALTERDTLRDRSLASVASPNSSKGSDPLSSTHRGWYGSLDANAKQSVLQSVPLHCSILKQRCESRGGMHGCFPKSILHISAQLHKFF